MANQDQDMVDLHSAIAKMYRCIYALHAGTGKNNLYLESLQESIQLLTKWFTDLITKPFFSSRRNCQMHIANEVPNLLKSFSDVARKQYLDKVIKAFGEMMGSDLTDDQGDKLEQKAKRLEQNVGN